MLDEIGKAALNISRVARTILTVNAARDDIKMRRSHVSDDDALYQARKQYLTLRRKVVAGLQGKGWTEAQICQITGLSLEEVRRGASLSTRIASVMRKKTTPTEDPETQPGGVLEDFEDF